MYFRHLILFLLSIAQVQAQSPFIHVDQIGYTPDAKKIAVLSNPVVGYNSNNSYSPSTTIELVDESTGQTVASYAPQTWNNGNVDTEWSGDQGWWVDFTSFNTLGNYYLYDRDQDESSAIFQIGNAIYDPVMIAAQKMFYYNRCNAPKQIPYADPKWTDGDNFRNNLQDANCRYVYDANNATLEKDLTGGWFDAGDYNKYVTFTMSTLHHLLWAYREVPEAFTDNANIPESGNGLADLLDEIKWELDWLAKMTNPDGSTHIKMGSISYSENIASPPSANTDQRYYGPTCASASLTIASVFAHAAMVFQDIPQYVTYANTLRSQAEAAWNHIVNDYGDLVAGTMDANCDDGTIKSGDADFSTDDYREYFLAAAIYLFEATGKSEYNTFLQSHYLESYVFGDTPNVAGDITSYYDESWDINHMASKDAYLLYGKLSGHDPVITQAYYDSFSSAVNNNWEQFFGDSDIDLYRAYLPFYFIDWGSNRTQGEMGVLNLLVNTYQVGQGPASTYENKAAGHLHYLHGTNPLGLLYLSNMSQYGGDRSADEIYHTWFYDGTIYDYPTATNPGPAPGYLVGGPNRRYSGNATPPANQPYLKSYAHINDVAGTSWEITEPSITYQAAYIRLLANVMYKNTTTTTNNAQVYGEDSCLQIFPCPVDQYFVIQGELDQFDIDIINENGSIVQTITSAGNEIIIDTSNFGAGLYILRMFNKVNRALSIEKIIKL